MIGQRQGVVLTELIARDEGTTNFSRANFGHVQDDDGGDEADTKTSDQAASDDKGETRRSCLKNASDNVNETPENNRWSTTKPVGKVTGNQSTCQMLSQQLNTKYRKLFNFTKESASGENGRDKRVVGTRQGG